MYLADTIQLVRVFEGQWHGRRFIRNRNPDGNLYARYLYWNDGTWNWSNN